LLYRFLRRLTWKKEVVVDSVTYQLVLHNPTGRSAPGTLTYHYKDIQQVFRDDPATLAAMVGEQPTAEFSLFGVEGTLTVPALLGLQPVKVSGLSFVSLMGPTLATIFTGTTAIARLDMEFSQIGSGAKYIGGAFNWQPEGQGGGMQPWCFIGTEQG
jgi:hypothetical protein